MQTDTDYLNDQYNNRNRVPDFLARHVLPWQAQSSKARETLSCSLDVAYGAEASEKLDIFHSESASGKSSVLFFIHGGYWRSLDKSDHSFMAPAFTRSGACVVIPNYALCPHVTIEHIALQQALALSWVYRHIDRYGGDSRRITVIGHSAGGHLAAMMLACQWKKCAPDLPPQLVRNALSLSGLHDLAPIMATPYLQTDLRLTSAQVQRCSPAYFAAPQGQLTALCGSDESDEFKRQNLLIQQAWGKAVVPVCEQIPNTNHFSVLEALCTAGNRAHTLALDLLKK